MTSSYSIRRAATGRRIPLRGLDYHLHEWGDAALAAPSRPTLVMLHGWMDVGASFQFVVDELDAIEGPTRHIVAPDWRGFGHTTVPATDSYWFPDYLADLDALLDALVPDGPVDLLGHSMGGNVAMSYAGVRPARIRRLINLEGFGLPSARPAEAPAKLQRWLDELRAPVALTSYAGAAEVAARLQRNNPRLTPDRAAWLAPQWAQPRADGRWHVLGDPAHKRVNPLPYHAEDVVEAWRRISAATLWVEGDATDVGKWWGGKYSREEFESRLAAVPAVRREALAQAGHMLHHDQPAALARLLAEFLG